MPIDSITKDRKKRSEKSEKTTLSAKVAQQENRRTIYVCYTIHLTLRTKAGKMAEAHGNQANA
jgi:hypothetical protein